MLPSMWPQLILQGRPWHQTLLPPLHRLSAAPQDLRHLNASVRRTTLGTGSMAYTTVPLGGHTANQNM